MTFDLTQTYTRTFFFSYDSPFSRGNKEKLFEGGFSAHVGKHFLFPVKVILSILALLFIYLYFSKRKILTSITMGMIIGIKLILTLWKCPYFITRTMDVGQSFQQQVYTAKAKCTEHLLLFIYTLIYILLKKTKCTVYILQI